MAGNVKVEDDDISVTSTQDEAYTSEQEFEVEKILAERKEHGKTRFLIRWKDYPEEKSTWEPRTNIVDEALVHAWNKRRTLQLDGKETPFDVAAFETKVKKLADEKADRRRRRKAKRQHLNLPVRSSESEQDDDTSSDEAVEEEESDDEPFKENPPKRQRVETQPAKGKSDKVAPPRRAATDLTDSDKNYKKPRVQRRLSESSSDPESILPQPQGPISRLKTSSTKVTTTSREDSSVEPNPEPRKTRTLNLGSRSLQPATSSLRRGSSATRGGSKVAHRNVFRSSENFKKRPDLLTNASDPTKQPKLFGHKRYEWKAQKESRDRADRAPDPAALGGFINPSDGSIIQPVRPAVPRKPSPDGDGLFVSGDEHSGPQSTVPPRPFASSVGTSTTSLPKPVTTQAQTTAHLGKNMLICPYWHQQQVELYRGSGSSRPCQRGTQCDFLHWYRPGAEVAPKPITRGIESESGPRLVCFFWDAHEKDSRNEPCKRLACPWLHEYKEGVAVDTPPPGYIPRVFSNRKESEANAPALIRRSSNAPVESTAAAPTQASLSYEPFSKSNHVCFFWNLYQKGFRDDSCIKGEKCEYLHEYRVGIPIARTPPNWEPAAAKAAAIENPTMIRELGMSGKAADTVAPVEHESLLAPGSMHNLVCFFWDLQKKGIRKDPCSRGTDCPYQHTYKDGYPVAPPPPGRYKAEAAEAADINRRNQMAARQSLQQTAEVDQRTYLANPAPTIDEVMKNLKTIPSNPLRPPYDPWKRENSICYFWANGACAKSDDQCRYIHSRDRRYAIAPAPSVCVHWLRNDCPDHECKNVHAYTPQEEVNHTPANAPKLQPSVNTIPLGPVLVPPILRRITESSLRSEQGRVKSVKFADDIPSFPDSPQELQHSEPGPPRRGEISGAASKPLCQYWAGSGQCIYGRGCYYRHEYQDGDGSFSVVAPTLMESTGEKGTTTRMPSGGDANSKLPAKQAIVTNSSDIDALPMDMDMDMDMEEPAAQISGEQGGDSSGATDLHSNQSSVSLSRLNFETFIPPHNVEHSPYQFFLMFPATQTAVEDLVHTWILRHHQESKIFSSRKEESWDDFTTSKKFKIGIVLVHEELILSLCEIPGIRDIAISSHSFDKRLTTFWCISENMGQMLATRLFPHGCAFLLTPSLLVAEPQKAYELLEWFIGSNDHPHTKYRWLMPANSWKMVCCRGLSDYVLDLANSKAVEKDDFEAKHRDEPAKDAMLRDKGLTFELCELRYKLHNLLVQLDAKGYLGESSSCEDGDPAGPYDTTESPIVYADGYIDPDDEPSLIEWFAGWAMLKLDTFRKFVVVGTDPKTVQRATRIKEIAVVKTSTVGPLNTNTGPRAVSAKVTTSSRANDDSRSTNQVPGIQTTSATPVTADEKAVENARLIAAKLNATKSESSTSATNETSPKFPTSRVEDSMPRHLSLADHITPRFVSGQLYTALSQQVENGVQLQVLPGDQLHAIRRVSESLWHVENLTSKQEGQVSEEVLLSQAFRDDQAFLADRSRSKSVNFRGDGANSPIDESSAMDLEPDQDDMSRDSPYEPRMYRTNFEPFSFGGAPTIASGTTLTALKSAPSKGQAIMVNVGDRIQILGHYSGFMYNAKNLRTGYEGLVSENILQRPHARSDTIQGEETNLELQHGARNRESFAVSTEKDINDVRVEEDGPMAMELKEITFEPTMDWYAKRIKDGKAWEHIYVLGPEKAFKLLAVVKPS